MKKRVFSIVLIIALLVTLSPGAVFARADFGDILDGFTPAGDGNQPVAEDLTPIPAEEISTQALPVLPAETPTTESPSYDAEIAPAAADVDTASAYPVTLTATDGSRRLSNIGITITDAGGKTADVRTDQNGVATTSLADGTYTAEISYSSSYYDYYGSETFTVNQEAVAVTITVKREYSYSTAETTYNNTTYFNHVDIRVAGTYTTGSNTDLATYNITLANPTIRVDNTESSGYPDVVQHFTTSTTYEWRKTNIKVGKDAVVYLTCDIYYKGEQIKSDYQTSFSGKADFIRAIQNCDAHQGLDFIIDATEIIAAVFYDVSYTWTGLPEQLAVVPAGASDLEPGTAYPINTDWQKGQTLVDEANGKIYTFSGWQEYSVAGDHHTTRTAISAGQTTLSIHDDTILYGVWTEGPLGKADSYLIITKKFENIDAAHIPADFYVSVQDPQGGETTITLEQFTCDASGGIYSYRLPVSADGRFTIAEYQYAADGYTTSAAVNVSENAASDHTHLTGTGTYSGDCVTITLCRDYDTGTACADLGTVAFTNTYTKKETDVHHPTGFTVKKVDEDGNPLSGAEFTLTDQATRETITRTTGTDGTACFDGFQTAATYTLTESGAPQYYEPISTTWTVTVLLKNGKPTIRLSEDKTVWETVYDWVAGITPDRDFVNGVLTVANTRKTAELTIRKEVCYQLDGQTVTVPDHAATADREYTFAVTIGDAEPVTVTLKDGEAYTVPDLKQGTSYSVVEKIPGDADWTHTPPANAVGVIGDHNVVTITNVFAIADVHNNPDLTVIKRGSDERLLSGAQFTLISADGTPVVKTTDAQGEVVFTSLLPGTYTLTETAAPAGYIADGTEYTVTVAAEAPVIVYDESLGGYVNVHGDTLTVTPDADFSAEDGTLTVRNERITGSVTIQKAWGAGSDLDAVAGNDTPDFPLDAIYVDLSGPDGYAKTVALNAGNNWTVTVDGLIPGQYSVTEDTQRAQIPGYDLTTDYSSSGTVILTGDALEEEVTLTNTYTRNEEEIHIPTGFTIRKIDEAGRPLAGAEFTLYDAEGSEVLRLTTDAQGTAVFTGFDQGAVYTLKETKAPENYAPVDTVWTVTVVLQDGEPTIVLNEEENLWERIYTWILDMEPSSQFETTENEDGLPEYTLTVVNQRKLGALTICKEVVYEEDGTPVAAPEDAAHDARYSFTVTIGDETQTITLAAGESYTFSDIPCGTSYRVVENIPADAAWTHTAPENATGTITEAATTVTMVNTYAVEAPEEICITVRKLWRGDNASTRPGSITVTLYRDGAAYNTQTLSAANQWGYTWSGLPADHTWAVDETGIPAGYTRTIVQNGNTFTITNWHSDIPHTGDDAMPWLWGMLAAAAAACILLTMKKLHKRES